MKGATLELLDAAWGRAMLDEDWERVDRINRARERVEALPARRACAWVGSDVCRHCDAACPIRADAA